METLGGCVALFRPRRFWILILCFGILLVGHYFWTLHKEDVADDADNGVTRLYERWKDDGPSAPITVVVPQAFRYQSGGNASANGVPRRKTTSP
jgi:hypothetical protein